MFNNPSITKDMVAQKLNKLDQELKFFDRAAASPRQARAESLDHILFLPKGQQGERVPPITEGADQAEKVEQEDTSDKADKADEKKFVKPELTSTASFSSRLEVPVLEPKRRRSNDSRESEQSIRRYSNGSSSSSSQSRPTSQEIDAIVAVEDDSSQMSRSPSSKEQYRLSFSSTSGPIIEQPEEDEVVVEYEPRRQQPAWKKRASFGKRPETDGLFPIPFVLVESGSSAEGGTTMTVGRHSKGKKKASILPMSLRRSKSDPGLGSQKDSSQASLNLGELKRSLSQASLRLSRSVENLYERTVEGKIRLTNEKATKVMEDECRRMLKSLGITVAEDFLEDLLNGVVFFDALRTLRIPTAKYTFTPKPVNLHQKQDNVATFVALLPAIQNFPPSRIFTVSDLFSEPRYLTKVYGCLLTLKRFSPT